MSEPTIAETAGWKPTGADPAAPLKEFYAPPAGPTLGRPEDDLPFTIRMQPPWTWERRHDPATRRVIRRQTAEPWQAPWILITGGEPYDNLLRDDDVRDWPIQHPVAVEAVMAKLRREEPQERPAPELVGDMGVESFKGGADG